jgi:hypothetical protein
MAPERFGDPVGKQEEQKAEGGQGEEMAPHITIWSRFAPGR